QTHTFGSSAIAEARTGAVLSGGTVSITARTHTTVGWGGGAPADTGYDVGNVPNGGSVNANITNVTRAGLTGGAKATAGSGPISGTDPDSVAIEATHNNKLDT